MSRDPEFARLGDVAIFRGGAGFPERFQGLKSGLHPFIKVSDLDAPGNERKITTAENWLDSERLEQLGPALHPAGATVFAKVGAALRLNRRRMLSLPTAIDNNLMSAEARPDLIDPDYLFYLLQIVDLGTICQGGGLPSVNQELISEVEVYVPSLAEQRRIAAVLDAWEDAIRTTERLGAALRKRMDWLRRLVLSGRVSPGDVDSNTHFSTLGSIGQIVKGRGLTKAEIDSSGVPCLRYAEIYTSYGNVARKLQSYTSIESSSRSHPLRYGDIVFAASGETKEDIGRALAYVGREQAVVGGDTVILTKHGQDPIFLAYALNSDDVNKQKVEYAKGHSVVHIHAPDIAKLKLWLPALSEQRRIAAMLSSADDEIANIKHRADLLRRQKRGLMQNLLNGEWPAPKREDTLLPSGSTADRTLEPAK